MTRSLVAAAFLFITACGFQPVYGPAAVGAGSGVIEISEIEGRTGHRLHQELVRTVGPGLPGFDQPGYLTIRLDESFARLAFQPDEAASRTDLIVNISYRLTDTIGNDIAVGQMTETTSFNVPQQSFGDIAAQTEARERAALLVSRRLRERLVVDARRYADAQSANGAATSPK